MVVRFKKRINVLNSYLMIKEKKFLSFKYRKTDVLNSVLKRAYNYLLYSRHVFRHMTCSGNPTRSTIYRCMDIPLRRNFKMLIDSESSCLFVHVGIYTDTCFSKRLPTCYIDWWTYLKISFN